MGFLKHYDRRWRTAVRAAWLVCVVAVTLAGPRAAHAVTIRITYTNAAGVGFNDPTLGPARKRAFEAAASVWAGKLTGPVPIIISAAMVPLPGNANGAVLGSAGPSTFFVDAAGLPRSSVFYPVTLANELTGQDLNQAQPEINAQFSTSVDAGTVLGGTRKFYYGLDGQPGTDIDFFSVVLHEFGHGLGFIDTVNQDGSFALNGEPAIYDTFLATGPALGATRLTALGQSGRAAAITSNALFFAGPNANAAGGGANPRIFAPNPFQPGSSVGHLDEATYHGINELMTPVATEVAHDPGPIVTAIFRDLGWQLNAPAPTPTPAPAATPTPIPRPANDNFANAQTISGNVGRVTGTNVNATKEWTEPQHAGNIGGKSVWYKWTAPFAGTATFMTTGSSFNTLLGVYTGTIVSALTAVASNNNVSTTNLTSTLTFKAVAGTTYRIAVDGFNATSTPSSAASGNVVLSWTMLASNDRFASAQVITGISGKVVGSNVNATKELGEPSHSPDGNAGGKSVWYVWTAPITGKATFSTAGSNFDTVLAVYRGSTVSTLSALPNGKNDDISLSVSTSLVTVSVVKGTIYHIAVDGFRPAGSTVAASGNIVLSWNSTAVLASVATVPPSPVVLSSASASAATGLIRLRFSLPMDPNWASNPALYTVAVNGHAVVVESASYAALGYTVTLAVPETALHYGDSVVVHWTGIRDAQGRRSDGKVGPLLAR